jgi:ribosomal protein S12 methylthiotransferase accessory factor YcaO
LEDALAHTKQYQDGLISKLRSPIETVRWTLARINALQEPYLSHFNYIEKPSEIPQYRIFGNRTFFMETGHTGTNGKGHSVAQALASGLVESAERYSCFRHLSNPENFVVRPASMVSENALDMEALFSNYPLELSGQLAEWRDHLQQVPFRWYQGKDQEGEPCLLPLMAIYRQVGTNGFAAGNSFEEALLHGICELIERDCFSRHIYHQLPAPLVPRDSIDSSQIQAMLSRFDDLGQRVEVRDFSLDYAMPALAVFRWRDDGVSLTVGVATEKNEALSRAITENSQGEKAPENNYSEGWVDAFLEHSEGQTRPYADIPEIGSEDFGEEIEQIKRVLEKKQRTFYYVDTTDPELQIPSAIVYIPQAYTTCVHPEFFYKRKVFNTLTWQVMELGSDADLAPLLEKSEAIYDQPDVLYYIRKAEVAYRQGDNALYRECLEAAFAGITKAVEKPAIAQTAAIPQLVLYHMAFYQMVRGDSLQAVRFILRERVALQPLMAKLRQQFLDYYLKPGSEVRRANTFDNLDFMKIDSPLIRELNLLFIFVNYLAGSDDSLTAEEIHAAYEDFVALRPQIKELYEEYQDLLEHHGYECALESIGFIQALSPTFFAMAGLEYQKGMLHYSLGNKEKAVEILEARVEKTPQLTPLLRQLLFIYKSQGDVEKMMDCIARIKKIVRLEEWAELI